MKSFKDPVYDYINCSSTELAVIDSPWFQRLRHCSQNGPARLVYPTLVGSRFEHSLGVMHLAEKMLRSVLHPMKLTGEQRNRFFESAERDIAAFYLGDERPQIDAVEQLVHWVRLAGLCHDLGHFPLSHTIEAVFDELFWATAFPSPSPKRACHEVISAEIVRQIAFRHGEKPLFSSAEDKALISQSDARAIILLLLLPRGVLVGARPIEQSIFATLHSIIVGTYDADRLDYLQRDTHLASANIGLIDVERFFDSLRIVEAHSHTNGAQYHYKIMPSAKAISAIETLLLERYKQKKWVHFHHKVVFYDRMVREAGTTILQDAVDEFFGDILLSEIYAQEINDPAELPSKYREQLQLQLSGKAEDRAIGPLSIYKINGVSDYSILDCEKLVNNPSSHFIDDVWFSQKCRKTLNTSYLHGILVDRKPIGISIWKTPDVFNVFWHAFGNALQGADAFWNALGMQHQGDLPGGKATVAMSELLIPIFRDDTDQYSDFFGVHQSKHFRYIEEYLTDRMPLCSDSICIKIANVRWKNLFYDVQSGSAPKILGFDGKEHSLYQYSGLIKSLVGLRGEILFYMYLVGDEPDMQKLRKFLLNSDRNAIVKELAKHFAAVIIERLVSHCGLSEENRTPAIRALLED